MCRRACDKILKWTGGAEGFGGPKAIRNAERSKVITPLLHICVVDIESLIKELKSIRISLRDQTGVVASITQGFKFKEKVSSSHVTSTIWPVSHFLLLLFQRSLSSHSLPPKHTSRFRYGVLLAQVHNVSIRGQNYVGVDDAGYRCARSCNT